MRYLLASALLALAVPCRPSLVAAQAPSTAPAAVPAGGPDGVMLVFERFADVFGSRLVAAFDSIPASRYGYRPTPGQQSIGHIAQHLERANYALCERVSDLRYARTAGDSMADSVKARWPKDTLVRRLRASLRFCDEALDRAGTIGTPALASSLLSFETDLAEHYSQLAVYMRLLGLVPPSALPPPPRVAVVLPPASLGAYVGRYRLAPGFELAVSLNGDSLIALTNTGSAPARLWPEAPDRFFVKEADAQVTFTRNRSGAVSGLVLHQYGRDRTGARLP